MSKAARQRLFFPEDAATETTSPSDRAESFRQTREAHRAETADDYAELIADLIDEHGEARSVDVAERLGVSHATVAKTLTRLQQQGLIVRRPYRGIFLTDAGRRLAEEARGRHRLVVAFLVSLGVSAEAAHHDAEGIEHHVSQETLSAFKRFLANYECCKGPRSGSRR
jgi:DtxR family transcriptional regulator, manganese transport regulator